jgi:uncharacterized protein YhjY with autotransporter beta-barrel domain
MNLRLPWLALAAVVLCAVPASAQEVVNFDDLPGPGPTLVPNGYNGLQWSGILYGPGADFGYATAVVSQPNAAGSPGGLTAISRATTFTFQSAYFSALNPTQLNIQAFNGAVLVGSVTLNLNQTATLTTLDLTNITEIEFNAIDQYAFDNIAVNFPSFIGATPGLTPNQSGVANNIDFNSNLPSGEIAAVIAGLQSLPPGSVGAALDQLTPLEFSRFVRETAFNNASFATESKDQYLASQRGADGTFVGGNGTIDASRLTLNDPSYDPGLAMIHSRMLAWNSPTGAAVSDMGASLLGGVDMKAMKEMPAAYNNPWNFYVQGNVILAQGFSQADIAHFDDNTESVTLGTDYRITPNLLVGLAAAYGHTDATLDPNGTSATIDSYSPGFYASYANKGWYANLTGDYIHNAYTQSRVIGFLSQTANSAPEGNEGVVNLDGGYEFHRGALTFGPLAGLQYTHLTVDGYSESGSDADLNVQEQDSDSLRSRLGGRVSFAFNGCGMKLTPHLDASWQHEFMDQARGVTSQFTSGVGSFDVRTENESRDSALVDAGVDAALNQTVTVFGDYQVQAGQDDYFGQAVQAGVKIGF